jgi:hypothetical protein
MLRELGGDASVTEVARRYREVGGTLVIDESDEALAGAGKAQGMACLVTPTVMRSPEVAAALARSVLDAAR